MGEINKCFISGILKQDPKVKEFDNGGLICSFSLEAVGNWSSKKTGKEGSFTQYHRISVPDTALYEEIRHILIPGNRFLVEGEIKTRSYEDKEGKKQSITEVVVNKYKGNVILLGEAELREECIRLRVEQSVEQSVEQELINAGSCKRFHPEPRGQEARRAPPAQSRYAQMQERSPHLDDDIPF